MDDRSRLIYHRIGGSPRHLTRLPPWAWTFADRLRDGPPIVADGGMGVLLSAAVPGLRGAGGGEHACARGGRLGARQLHQRRRRPDRDEHVRRQPAEARPASPRGRARADQLGGGEAGARGAGDHRPGGADRRARSGRSASRAPHDPEPFAEQARILEGRGADLFVVETFYDLDELEVAIGAVRSVSGLPIVALMSFDSERSTIGGVSARARGASGCARSASRRSARTTARPGGGARRARGDVGARSALAALPNVGLATFSGARLAFPHATPEYFGEFAARARALGARVIGGCCGTTPAQIAAIRAAVDDNRAARTRARGRASGARAAAGRRSRADRARAAARARASSSSRCSSTRRSAARCSGLVDAAAAVRESGLAQVVDVNDNPRARARMSGMMASVAIAARPGSRSSRT